MEQTFMAAMVSILLASCANAQARNPTASDVLSKQVVRLNAQGRHLDAARLYEARGRFGDAEPLYRSDFSLVRCLYGANHPVTLNSATNLARVYEAMGRHSDAETIRSRAKGELFEFCSMKSL